MSMKDEHQIQDWISLEERNGAGEGTQALLFPLENVKQYDKILGFDKLSVNCLSSALHYI